MSGIMLQGTGSDVGKSILAAGICRAFCDRGIRVRPFKAQNMSNNAAPTPDGGEIGRAQALQALACRTAPSTDMNPVLLKPQSDCESQVIVNGKISGILQAADFLKDKEPLLQSALRSYRRLEQQCDIVIAEDAIRKDDCGRSDAQAVTIAVPVLPHIANFDDFDALAAESSVDLVYVYPGQPLPARAKMVILPGSKTTISDLEAFRRQEWDIDLKAHIRRGGYVMGICGGYQMLGETIEDPMGIEGEIKTIAGLGLLPIHTTLDNNKRVTDTTGVSLKDNIPFHGYEIHCGKTRSGKNAAPLLRLANGETDGTLSPDGHVAGCYIHRLFDHPAQRAKWLDLLQVPSDGIEQGQRVEDALDQVAEQLEKCLDLDAILDIAQKAGQKEKP